MKNFETIEEQEIYYNEKYSLNDRYQPMWAYIPDLDDVVEYQQMTSNSKHEKEVRKDPNWKFVGYGYQVYTYLHDYDKFSAGSDTRLCAIFQRVK